ncbi:ABC transporter substrate-binding protein [Spirochaeta cellobiosiphila]|uniref:ABC transporter substrate-binding protein n=1 Tax=Spirochaeta cellobiosiphila TaxID=504483 RepID=UPI0004116754|nr:ABC transporter substrate-binding protein [Spirochaeta cellobiosiphila]
MNNEYFSITDSVHQIISQYPMTLDIFIANGYPQFKEASKLESLGSRLSFEAAMKMKNKNVQVFSELLNEVIKQNSDEKEIYQSPSKKASLEVAGVLPCPVKIPLIEGFETFVKEYGSKTQEKISYRLQSASGGINWLEEEVKLAQEEKDIPDLFISAGFELFFDKDLIGRFRDQKTFKDMSSLKQFNSCFDELDLKDSRGNYSIIAGVPAVFLVDHQQLGDRKAPRTWDELLSEEFTGSISLPIEDLDLFNAVILTLYHKKGTQSIEALGRNLLSSLHPAQMVKNNHSEKPAVTVLPWFFTKMILPGTALEMIWPEDGAILSPIFVAGKRKKEAKLKEIIRYFESEEVGRLMRDRGYFPVVNPHVDNKIPEGKGFQWVGWDFIYDHDLTETIELCTEHFNKTSGRAS